MLGANEGDEAGDVRRGEAVARIGHVLLVQPGDFDVNAWRAELYGGWGCSGSEGIAAFIGRHGKYG